MKRQYRQYRASGVAAPAASARRRRAAAIAGGVLAALLASVVGLDSYSNGGRGFAAVAAAAKDPAALFAGRSPGARAGGWLMQTKPGHPAEALSRREGPKPPPMSKDQTAITYAPKDHDMDTPAPFSVAELAPTPTEATALFTSFDPVPLEDFVPGGGGGEDGPPGGTTPTYPGGGGGGAITLQSTPVPEPSVWAMLILGFFGVGAAMRARRRVSMGVTTGLAGVAQS